ncbi:MAG: glycosyltransferase family 2 protein, partial [Anaerolineae bacterium]|nr:glycosyltransferase family 2 protein [Anaerolineae bacterium]
MYLLLIILLWLSVLAIVWTYAGYPLFILLLARWRPRPHLRADIQPSVSLIIPAYNEEAIIAEKLENVLEMDYPQEMREVLVVADGSTDRTVEIVERYASRGVQLLFQSQRRGKIAAMNRAVPHARGEILVFSDANAMIEQMSLQTLVRSFADTQVVCVSGEKRIRSDSQVQARGESAYWRYEARLKEAESQVSTVIGAVGEFFAIRKERYRSMEEDNLIEDFVLSMRLVMDGWRVVYEPRAIAWEEASPSLRAEWERRSRMAVGGFQAIGRLRALFSPRHGLVAFQYFSHKVLRWTAPFAMLLAWTSSALLYSLDFYRLLFWGQTGFYLLALMGWVTVLLGWRLRLLQLAFYFCFANS